MIKSLGITFINTFQIVLLFYQQICTSSKDRLQLFWDDIVSCLFFLTFCWLTSWSCHLQFCRLWNAQGTHLRGAIQRSVKPPIQAHSNTYPFSRSHAHTTHSGINIQMHTHTNFHRLRDHLPHTPTHIH